MSLSRRLRYEILRRDGFCCHYCGAPAHEGVPLVVDHVIPVALGGSDEPTNLLTACRSCNAGKAATNPDDDLVARVDERAQRWASAMERAAAIQAERREDRTAYVTSFEDAWARWTYQDGRAVTRDPDWLRTVERWHDLGLEAEALVSLVDNVLPRSIPDYRMWRYFCGAAWNLLRERTQIAGDLFVEDE